MDRGFFYFYRVSLHDYSIGDSGEFLRLCKTLLVASGHVKEKTENHSAYYLIESEPAMQIVAVQLEKKT